MSPAKYDILLLDDGELSEIRGAARALNAAVHTDMDGPDTPVEWSLVVSSTRHLGQLESIAINLSAKRVVVLDQLSQTLRARMRRARVDFFLCRPVHPEALRLLLLHCLYKGPERRQRRVAIGAPVRFRSGFRRGGGVLVDISDTGCRILTSDPMAIHQKLLVFLPKPGRSGRTFFVRAEVVRISQGDQPPHQMALRFYSLGGASRRRIDELMAHHEESPAVYSGDCGTAVAEPAENVGAPMREPARSTPRAAAEPRGAITGSAADVLETDDASIDADTPSLEVDRDEPQARDTGPEQRLAAPAPEPKPERRPEGSEPTAEQGSEALEPRFEQAPGAPPDLATRAAGERRREPRRQFRRQVVALDRSATRILIGRDLSVGGMRVDSNPALLAYKTFRLSIHVGEGELPLVVRARVVRDDGDEGTVLRFEQLGFAVQEHLRKCLRELPILAPGQDGAPERVLVTEILDERDGMTSTG